MRCSVQNCFNDTKRTTKSHGITFHLFPKEPHLRTAWMEALGMSDWEPKDRSTICSEHFRNDDFYETRCGLRKIKNGAVPVSAQDLANDLDAPAALRVCRICLATECKMFNIRDHKLEQAFTEVSGMTMSEEDKLPQRLCWECGHRLLTAARFKSKVLRAHDLLTGLPHASPYITIRDIRSINRRQNQLRSHLIYKHFDPNDFHIHFNDDQIIVKSEIKETEEVEEKVPPIAEVEIIKDEKNNTELFYQEFDNYDDNFNDNDKYNNDASINNDNNEVNEDSDDKVLSEVHVKKKRKVKKVKVKKKEKIVRKKDEEDNPMTTMDKYKNSDVKRRKTTDGLDESLFTITTLSYDEQIAEIQKRQESTNYKSAPYKCGVCYRGFLVRDRYDAHVVRHSEQSGAYECFICKSRLKSARALRKHLTAQHTEKFSCKGCPFVTRNRGVAREHEKWHAGTKYQCPHCPSEFDKLTTYMGHIRIKHVSDFVCELCGYTFVSKKGIDVHKKKKHRLQDKTVELEGPYCETCEVRFVSEEAHARHLKLSSRHSSDSDPNRIRNDSQSINAEKNGRVVRRVERRPVIHARDGAERQDAAGPVTCEQCGVQLRDLRLYAQHFRRAHPDKNRTKYPAMKTPCMCEQCGRIFQSMALLKDHMWVHTGEKRFKCDRCEKSFTQKTNLVFHMRVHSASRPSYECPLCGKHFAFFNNRRRHMFIHTGLKPFKCETCGKCFTTAGEQRAHVEHVHLKKPWPKRQRHREAEPAPWQKCLDPMED
ncbi:zinc finger protein 724-like [Leguminivora glycinivorella]|uniref:zinc finger protein 724-like n=1 Tax=Leguminivora glycinivorella TaxID=1035111 RepID=UPI0020100DD5|nr:zinc finger protein 724-like [Leguminivora glycinivorella]